MRRLGRRVLRFIWMGGHVCGVAADFALLALRCRFTPPIRERALWLHRSCRRTLRIFSLSVETSGPVPTAGLLVSNHLGYADIVLLASLTPAVFVSKSEIRRWPVFGWFARWAGTLFIRREQRRDVGRLSEQMRALLDGGHLVVLFPESTSSNGRQVLPFRSSLFEPVIDRQHPVFAARIGYELPDGSAENEVCYWGDMTFFPHLLRLMGRRHIHARVRFSRIERPAGDRKELARQLHGEVARLPDAAPPLAAS